MLRFDLRWLFFFIVLVMINSCLVSCENDKTGKDGSALAKGTGADSSRSDMAADTNSIREFPLIRYKQITIKDASQLKSLREKYNHPKEWHAGWKTIITLNRKEWRFMRVGQTIVVPDTIIDDIRAYSIFPQFYPGAANLPKCIVVSCYYQCYAAYEYGKQVRFVAVNSGKERTPTYPGRYALTWKERVRRSSLDSNWVMPFTYNYHGEAGSAFHQFEMPGFPASHSCMRQFMEDAEWLFSWGEGQKFDEKKKPIRLSGTPVIIIDHYDFAPERKQMWTKLTSNKDTIMPLPPNPMAVEEALIPIIQIPESSRGRLPNRKRFEEAEQVLRDKGIIRPNVKLTPSVNFNAKRRADEAKKAGLELKSKQSGQPVENNSKTTNGTGKPKPAAQKPKTAKPNAR